MPPYNTIEAIDDEGYDDEAYDDEATDDEGVLDVIGGILNPAAAIGNVVGGLFGGGAGRPPLRQVPQVPAGGGVSTATLNTPQGNATLRLPEPVVTRSDFDEKFATLRDAVNADSARINSVSKDLETLGGRVGSVVSNTQRDIGRLRTELARHRQANRAAFARIRREQSQQAMMSMVVTMMMTSNQQNAFNDHLHDGVTTGTGQTGTPSGASTDSNSSSMMLPLVMMMGSSSDNNSSDNSMNMMMPLMLMMMTQQGK